MTSPEAKEPDSSDRDDFFAALRTGLLVGGAALLVALPAVHYWKRPVAPTVTGTAQQQVPSQTQAQALPPPPARPPAPSVSPGAVQTLRLASFGKQQPSPAVRHVANWSVYSNDHQQMAFVVVDKQNARVWVFSPQGKLVSATPALLGSAVGDHSVPGIGEKPLSQVLPDEKTTPAGRFIAEHGVNLKGEDIVWVDYDAAVSMHRVRANVKSERRLERLASPSAQDNRISFGCINLPKAFYETVLSPTVKKHGAVVYVLPETKSPAEVFGSHDVPPRTHVAQR